MVRVAGAYLAIAVVVGLLASLASDENEPSGPKGPAGRPPVAGPFPLERRSPQVVAGSSQRVLVALRRPSVGELGSADAREQRAHVRSLNREARALLSSLRAKGVRFGDPVLYARVWSGFAATISTRDIPRVQALGLRIEPVRRFYPAQVSATEAPEARPLPTKAAEFGTVAVLDAFEKPMPGVRVVSTGFRRARGAQPLEARHSGIRLAGVVLGEVPRAEVVGIRIAGPQPLESGRFDVFATSDQLLAGLERAVDLDGNGDSEDAASVAVTGVNSPYSGFPDSPEAQAVSAAADLGTLVVAPAGNGGEGTGTFGTIGSPGAAEDALTVAALDNSGDVAPASSRGPTYGLGPKPDLAISGGGKSRFGIAWGTAIAAGRVAGVAAALRAERPALDARQAAAVLIGTAAPRGLPLAAGGGDPLLQAARAANLAADPPQLAIRSATTDRIRLTNLGRTPLTIRPKLRFERGNPPAGARPRPVEVRIGPGASATIAIPAAFAPGTAGHVEAGPIRIPFSAVADPAPPRIGAPKLVQRRGRPAGVRFVAGGISRKGSRLSVRPVGSVVLTLEGPEDRELTPPGGARDLLPAEYAYTLTDDVVGGLPAGSYRFVLRARGTAGGREVTRRSSPFRIR